MSNPFWDGSGTGLAVAVGIAVTMVCAENTVEREIEAEEAPDTDTTLDTVETGSLVTIVVVAFWAQTASKRAAKASAR